MPDVMDVSFWLFKNSRDTLIEMVAVLQTLIEIDPSQENQYRDGIKEISKELSVQDGLADVDRSRVYVNIPKLLRWADTELRESFERYDALLRAGIISDDPAVLLRDFATGKATHDNFTHYPDDEAGQLLLDIYKSIAAKYLHDPDIGLDAYLSMRIRHGSLAGHIRGPLEAAGLLAVRDQGTNQYRTLRKPHLSRSFGDDDWRAANRAIQTFSREFDKIIDELIKEKLQIKTDTTPHGLFTFEPSPLLIYFLSACSKKGVSDFSQL